MQQACEQQTICNMMSNCNHTSVSLTAEASCLSDVLGRKSQCVQKRITSRLLTITYKHEEPQTYTPPSCMWDFKTTGHFQLIVTGSCRENNSGLKVVLGKASSFV